MVLAQGCKLIHWNWSTDLLPLRKFRFVIASSHGSQGNYASGNSNMFPINPYIFGVLWRCLCQENYLIQIIIIYSHCSALIIIHLVVKLLATYVGMTHTHTQIYVCIFSPAWYKIYDYLGIWIYLSGLLISSTTWFNMELEDNRNGRWWDHDMKTLTYYWRQWGEYARDGFPITKVQWRGALVRFGCC